MTRWDYSYRYYMILLDVGLRLCTILFDFFDLAVWHVWPSPSLTFLDFVAFLFRLNRQLKDIAEEREILEEKAKKIHRAVNRCFLSWGKFIVAAPSIARIIQNPSTQVETKRFRQIKICWNPCVLQPLDIS